MLFGRHRPVHRALPVRRQRRIETLESRLVLDSTVVFNELMYHPAASEETLEWLELQNLNGVQIDLSNWSLRGGIDYVFPAGTTIAGHGYLVVAISPAALQSATGFSEAKGPFTGRLSNDGERIDLLNNSDRVMDTVDYADQGAWPVAPDGGGVSLAKRRPDTASDNAAVWSVSDQIGGTPGAANFPPFTAAPISSPAVSSTGSWKYSATDIAPEANWNSVGYNDATWSIGNGLLGGGDASAPVAVTNPSFESDPLNPPPGIGPIAGWTGVGNTGSNELAGTLNNNNVVPDGTRVGVIQYVGSLSQSLGDLEPGRKYTVKYFENERGLVATNKAVASVTLGATTIVAAHDVSKFTRARRVISQPFTADSTTATLTFANSAANVAPFGDNALLLDKIEVTRAVPLIGNGNLESYVPSGTFQINPNGSPGVAWSFTGTAGLSRNGSPFQAASGGNPVIVAPEGNQMAFITSVSSISQTVTGFESGVTYSLSWQESRRTNAGNANDLEIVLDAGLPTQIILSAAHLVSNPTMVERTSSSFLSTKSSYTLTLRTTNPLGGSATTFIDDLHFNFVTEAPPVATTLPLGAATYYFRAPFNFDGVPADTQLKLNYLADDGAVFYLNGQEIYRTTNLPAGQTHNTPAAPGITTPVFSGPITVPAAALVNGANVLAVEVHQAAPDGGDVFFGADLTTVVTPRPASTDLVINEVSGGNDAATFVEITNIGAASVSTESFKIVNSLGGSFSIPPQMVAPGAKLSFDQATLGFHADAGARIFLTKAYGNQVPDAVVVEGVARGRSPDGTGPWYYETSTSPGAANTILLHDAIVINEIMYHPRDPADGSRATTPEWIELYNRSAAAIDLSGWSIAGGMSFDFPLGTTLAAHAYLVVASDAAALQSQYPASTILGNFSQGLSNSNDLLELFDSVGNRADAVHYYDDGRWAPAADGGGTSLELRDPDADNSVAEAWAASNESNASTWQTVTYRGIATAETAPSPTLWNEFVLGLLDRGEVLLDDLHVVEFPSTNPRELLQNGTFETGQGSWRIIGNHRGEVIVDPTNAANHVLRLTANGATEHMHNHAETTLAGGATIVNGREYEISYRVKWISGTNLLNTRLYFNRLPRTQVLTTPQTAGTPGFQNSRYETNLGPTFADLQHSPMIPAAGQSVTVSVAAADPQAVSAAVLWYSVNGAAWISKPMTPSGGRYSAVVPGQAASAAVKFYVAATDTLGAAAQFPARGPLGGAYIKVQDGQTESATLHNLRIIMSAADNTAMYTATNVMSNDRFPATVIYDGVVYYDVGVRLKGSGYGRAGATAGYNIKFRPDELFRGVQETITIDRGAGPDGIGASQHELLFKHIATYAGDIPGMYDDVINVIATNTQFSGLAQLLTTRYNSVFLDSQFDGGSDGTLYKMDLIYYSTVTVDGNPQSLKLPPAYNAVVPLGGDIQDLGSNEESYRWNYLLQNNTDRDDYSRLIDLAKAFSLSGAALDARTAEVMDLDQWMRMFAFESLTGVADTYNQGLPHNLELYVRPSDNRVLALPWDSDFAFYYGPTAPIFGQNAPNMLKIINLPGNLHRFYGHLLDIITTTFNSTYLAPWAAYYGQVTGQNFTTATLNYVDQRRSHVLSQLPANVPFAVTTNSGQDFSVAATETVIAGAGWVDAKEIRIVGRPGALALTWTDATHWQATIPLAFGANALTFEAYGYRGQLVGADSITITNTLVGPSALAQLRITELMYHPADPPPLSIYAASDFEYVELQNIGDLPLPLAGVSISGGISFTFGVQTLAPGGRVLVVGNRAAFESRYGVGLDIAGEFTGNLSNSGEQLILTGPASEVILDFAYSDFWYPSTDGAGYSLVVADAHAPAAAWPQATQWRPSGKLGGSPGSFDAPASVSGRFVMYNNSQFDGFTAGASASDDAALATDKTPLIGPGTASFANYSSYSRGLNALVVDLVGRAGAPPISAADFEFRIGNSNTPNLWSLAPLPIFVSTRALDGVGGGDRVTLVWADLAIQNTWLQVTVKATAATGLASPDVFYFGNAIGESGDSVSTALVNATDEIAVRMHPRTFLDPAPIDDHYDFNRDALVNATDQILVRSHQTTIGGSLQLITVPGPMVSPMAAAAQQSAPANFAAHDIAVGTVVQAGRSALSIGAADRQSAVTSELSRPNDPRAGAPADGRDASRTLTLVSPGYSLALNRRLRDAVDVLKRGDVEHLVDEDLIDLLAALTHPGR